MPILTTHDISGTIAMHDTENLYWNQMSFNNANSNSKPVSWMANYLNKCILRIEQEPAILWVGQQVNRLSDVL